MTLLLGSNANAVCSNLCGILVTCWRSCSSTLCSENVKKKLSGFLSSIRRAVIAKIMKDKTVASLSENHIYFQLGVANEYEVVYNFKKQANKHHNVLYCTVHTNVSAYTKIDISKHIWVICTYHKNSIRWPRLVSTKFWFHPAAFSLRFSEGNLIIQANVCASLQSSLPFLKETHAEEFGVTGESRNTTSQISSLEGVIMLSTFPPPGAPLNSGWQ